MTSSKCDLCKSINMEFMAHMGRFALYGCVECGNVYAEKDDLNFNSWDENDDDDDW